MIKFTFFNIKAIVRKKLFIIPMILIFASVVGIYAGNTRAANNSNLAKFAQSDYTYNQKQAKMDSNFVDDFISARMEHEKATIDAFNNKDWSKAAQNSIFTTNQDISSLEKTGGRDDQIANLKSQKLVLAYVEKHNVYPEIPAFGVTGFNFLFDSLTIYFPWFWFSVIVFIIIPIFTWKFQNGKNIDNIIPKNNVLLDFDRLITAGIVVVSSYFILILFAFGIASLFHGMGDSNFPIIIQKENFGATQPIGQLLVKTIILQTLSLLAAIVLGQFISNLTQSDMLAAFLTVGLLLIQIIAPFIFSFMNSFIQLIPGVYTNAPKILTGSLIQVTKNTNLTFSNGIIILLSTIIVVTLMNISYNRITFLKTRG
jgi:hypothetical protein